MSSTSATAVMALSTLVAFTVSFASANKLSLTPPMGWMSWEVFRCRTDCSTDPTTCVGEINYMQQADALVSGGFRAVGYKTISIDDCWEQKVPERDSQGRLQPDPTRFPHGFKYLADYMHSKNVSFGIYSDMGTYTCGGYPGSENHEQIDAETFAAWGVDYLKLDGCNNHAPDDFAVGYPKMGMALQGSGRDIVYSCSWPAYLGGNESAKPFDAMIAAGCNLWRNWNDIQGNWDSVSSIIDHWGDFGPILQQTSGPNGKYGGHWHDPDMLLDGEHELGGLPGITLEEGKTQFGMWSLLAAPLIMGNDLRNVSDAAKAVLLNEEVIAIDQDPLGMMGLRITPKNSTEVWARNLSNGDIAVGLLNKGSSPSGGVDNCEWKVYTGGYNESTGGGAGNAGCTVVSSAEEARATCCGLESQCVSASVPVSGQGEACFKKNDNGGFTVNSGYTSVVKTKQGPQPTPTGATITATLASVGWKHSTAKVRDLFAQQDLGTMSSLKATVPPHGLALFRLSPP